VSLFHYRNHGDDFGRVLVGIQVPESSLDSLKSFLNNLGYSYSEETNNQVYQIILRRSDS